MKAREELEAALAALVIRCHKGTFGRGPVESRAFLLETLAVVHLRQVLTTMESHLLRADPGAGNQLVRELRMRASARWKEDGLHQAVEAVLGRPVRVLMTDVCPETDMAVYVFCFDSPTRTKAGGVEPEGKQGSGPGIMRTE